MDFTETIAIWFPVSSSNWRIVFVSYSISSKEKTNSKSLTLLPCLGKTLFAKSKLLNTTLGTVSLGNCVDGCADLQPNKIIKKTYCY